MRPGDNAVELRAHEEWQNGEIGPRLNKLRVFRQEKKQFLAENQGQLRVKDSLQHLLLQFYFLNLHKHKKQYSENQLRDIENRVDELKNKIKSKGISRKSLGSEFAEEGLRYATLNDFVDNIEKYTSYSFLSDVRSGFAYSKVSRFFSGMGAVYDKDAQSEIVLMRLERRVSNVAGVGDEVARVDRILARNPMDLPYLLSLGNPVEMNLKFVNCYLPYLRQVRAEQFLTCMITTFVSPDGGAKDEILTKFNKVRDNLSAFVKHVSIQDVGHIRDTISRIDNAILFVQNVAGPTVTKRELEVGSRAKLGSVSNAEIAARKAALGSVSVAKNKMNEKEVQQRDLAAQTGIAELATKRSIFGPMEKKKVADVEREYQQAKLEYENWIVANGHDPETIESGLRSGNEIIVDMVQQGANPKFSNTEFGFQAEGQQVVVAGLNVPKISSDTEQNKTIWHRLRGFKNEFNAHISDIDLAAFVERGLRIMREESERVRSPFDVVSVAWAVQALSAARGQQRASSFVKVAGGNQPGNSLHAKLSQYVNEHEDDIFTPAGSNLSSLQYRRISSHAEKYAGEERSFLGQVKQPGIDIRSVDAMPMFPGGKRHMLFTNEKGNANIGIKFESHGAPPIRLWWGREGTFREFLSHAGHFAYSRFKPSEDKGGGSVTSFKEHVRDVPQVEKFKAVSKKLGISSVSGAPRIKDAVAAVDAGIAAKKSEAEIGRAGISLQVKRRKFDEKRAELKASLLVLQERVSQEVEIPHVKVLLERQIGEALKILASGKNDEESLLRFERILGSFQKVHAAYEPDAGAVGSVAGVMRGGVSYCFDLDDDLESASFYIGLKDGLEERVAPSKVNSKQRDEFSHFEKVKKAVLGYFPTKHKMQIAENIFTKEHLERLIDKRKDKSFLPYIRRGEEYYETVAETGNKVRDLFKQIYRFVDGRNPDGHADFVAADGTNSFFHLGDPAQRYTEIYNHLISGNREQDYPTLTGKFKAITTKERKLLEQALDSSDKLVDLLNVFGDMNRHLGGGRVVNVEEIVENLNNDGLEVVNIRDDIIRRIEDNSSPSRFHGRDIFQNPASKEEAHLAAYFGKLKQALDDYCEKKNSLPYNLEFASYRRMRQLEGLKQIFVELASEVAPGARLPDATKDKFESSVTYFSKAAKRKEIEKGRADLLKAQEIAVSLANIAPRKSASSNLAAQYSMLEADAEAAKANVHKLCYDQVNAYAQGIFADVGIDAALINSQKLRLHAERYQLAIKKILEQKIILEQKYQLELDFSADGPASLVELLCGKLAEMQSIHGSSLYLSKTGAEAKEAIQAFLRGAANWEDLGILKQNMLSLSSLSYAQDIYLARFAGVKNRNREEFLRIFEIDPLSIFAGYAEQFDEEVALHLTIRILSTELKATGYKDLLARLDELIDQYKKGSEERRVVERLLGKIFDDLGYEFEGEANKKFFIESAPAELRRDLQIWYEDELTDKKAEKICQIYFTFLGSKNLPTELLSLQQLKMLNKAANKVDVEDNRIRFGVFERLQSISLLDVENIAKAKELLKLNLIIAVNKQSSAAVLDAINLYKKLGFEVATELGLKEVVLLRRAADLIVQDLNNIGKILPAGASSIIQYGSNLEFDQGYREIIADENADKQSRLAAKHILFGLSKVADVKIDLLLDNDFVPSMHYAKRLFSNDFDCAYILYYLNSLPDSDVEKLQKLQKIYDKLIEFKHKQPNSRILANVIADIEEAKSAGGLFADLRLSVESAHNIEEKFARLEVLLQADNISPDFFHRRANLGLLKEVNNLSSKGKETLRRVLGQQRNVLFAQRDFAQDKASQLLYLYYAVLEEKVSDKSLLTDAIVKLFGREVLRKYVGDDFARNDKLAKKFADLLLENGYASNSLTDFDYDIICHGKNLRGEAKDQESVLNKITLQTGFAEILASRLNKKKGFGQEQKKQEVTLSYLRNALLHFERTGEISEKFLEFINSSEVFVAGVDFEHAFAIGQMEAVARFTAKLINEAKVKRIDRASDLFLLAPKLNEYSIQNLRNLISSNVRCEGRIVIAERFYESNVREADDIRRLLLSANPMQRVEAQKAMMVLFGLAQKKDDFCKTKYVSADGVEVEQDIQLFKPKRQEIMNLFHYFVGLRLVGSTLSKTVPNLAFKRMLEESRDQLSNTEILNLELLIAVSEEYNSQLYDNIIRKLNGFESIAEIDSKLLMYLSAYIDRVATQDGLVVAESCPNSRKIIQQMYERKMLLSTVKSIDEQSVQDENVTFIESRTSGKSKTDIERLEDVCRLLPKVRSRASKEDVARLRRKVGKLLSAYDKNADFMDQLSPVMLNEYGLTGLDVERLRDYYLHGIALSASGFSDFSVKHEKNEGLEKFCQALRSKVIIANQLKQPEELSHEMLTDLLSEGESHEKLVALEYLLAKLERDSTQTIENEQHPYLDLFIKLQAKATAGDRQVAVFLPRIKAAMMPMVVDRNTGLSVNDRKQIKYFYFHPKELLAFEEESLSLSSNSNPVQVAIYVMKKIQGRPSQEVGNEILKIVQQRPMVREEILLALTGNEKLVCALKAKESTDDRALRSAIFNILAVWSKQEEDQINIGNAQVNASVIRGIGKGIDLFGDSQDERQAKQRVMTMASGDNISRFFSQSEAEMITRLRLNDLAKIAIFGEGAKGINYEKYKQEIAEFQSQNKGKLHHKIVKAIATADFVKSLVTREEAIMSKEEFEKFSSFIAKSIRREGMSPEKRAILGFLLEKYSDDITINYGDFIKKVRSGDFADFIVSLQADPAVIDKVQLLRECKGGDLPLARISASDNTRATTALALDLKRLLPESNVMTYSFVRDINVAEVDMTGLSAVSKLSIFVENINKLQCFYEQENRREDKYIEYLFGFWGIRSHDNEHVGKGEYRQVSALKLALEKVSDSLKNLVRKQETILSQIRQSNTDFIEEIHAQILQKIDLTAAQSIEVKKIMDSSLDSVSVSEKIEEYASNSAAVLFKNRLEKKLLTQITKPQLSMISEEINAVVAVRLQTKEIAKLIEDNKAEIGKTAKGTVVDNEQLAAHIDMLRGKSYEQREARVYRKDETQYQLKQMLGFTDGVIGDDERDDIGR